MSNQVTKVLLLSMLLFCFASTMYASNCGTDPSDPTCAPSFSLTWHMQGSGQQHSAQSSGAVWTGSSWLITFTPQSSNGMNFTGGQLASSPDPFLSYSLGVIGNSTTHNMIFNFDYKTTFSTTYPIYSAEDFFFDGLQDTSPSGGSTTVTPNPANGYYNFLQTSLVNGVIIPNFQLGLGCTAPKGHPCESKGPYDVLELYSHTNSGTLEIKGQFTLAPNALYTISGATYLYPIPEPGTLALVGAGIVGLAGVLRRKLTV